MIKTAAASIVGRSHLASARKCQDAVATIQRRNAACIALADGAGSKRRSETGAQVASERVVKVALDHFDQLFALANSEPVRAARLVVDPVLVALRRKNKRKREPLDSLASTLLFAAYKEGRYVAGHLGDGVVCIRDGPEAKLLSAPENGEYANSTYFVTDENALTHFRLYKGIAGDGFGAILMSDGTAESLYERSTGRIGSATQKILDWSERLSAKRMKAVLMANLTQVFSQKSSDDCSIAVMTVKGHEYSRRHGK